MFIVWNYYPNTAYTNHTKATVKGLTECGCRVDVVSIKPIITEETTCIKGQRKVIGGGFLPTAIGTIKNYLLMERSIKNYDVIYCACSVMHVVRSAIKKARKYHIPIVHERTELPDIFYEQTRKSQKALEVYLRKVSQFDKVFVISNPIKNYFEKNGVPSDKLIIYPMIVDPHRFENVHKHTHDYRYMAYCGNLSNSKDGVADLIEAYGKSRSKMTHMLMLIGSIPSVAEMRVYQEIIERYNLGERVLFQGQVSSDEMPQLLMDADLLLLSRPNNRQALGGFPTKLGEYLTTGNPVLITQVGDIGNYIIDGKNGYLAAPGDVEGFSEKMDYIIDHYEESILVGKKGRELTMDAFNYKVQTRKVVDILETLV